jgi:hypothetical protein
MLDCKKKVVETTIASMMKGEWPIELKDKDKVLKADQRPSFKRK